MGPRPAPSPPSSRAARSSGALTAADLDAALSAARGGNEAAFVVVYRAVHPGLVRYLRFLVGDDADDVASETWAAVCRDLPSFRGEADQFRGWVATIGRNRAIDLLRARGRRPVDPVPAERLSVLADSADVEREVLDGLSTRDALAVIATLPSDQAEAVLLRAVVGLDAAMAGAVLGKRPGAVRTSASRGLRTLRGRLEAGGAA
ncbi:MAG: RNA polymerase sigma factor [bacterium]